MNQLRNSGAAMSIAIVTALASIATTAHAECGLCVTQVITTGTLAECYLDRFPTYEARSGAAIAIDLSDCPNERGVVEALSSPTAATAEPDLRFLLSRSQLVCLKERLENPSVALDPTATIRLDDCE